jgi:uncharacterized protein DUF3828
MRKIHLATILASLAIALLAPAIRAQDAGAQAFLQSLYSIYEKSEKALDIGSETKAARYFVASVARLIGRDVAESRRRNEVGRLDFDPFVAAQDWAPTRIALSVAPGASADRATGTARFTAEGEKEPTVVTLDLVRTPAGWRIADIHWSGQKESLVAVLSKKS